MDMVLSRPSGSFQCTYFRPNLNWNAALRTQTKKREYGQCGCWSTPLTGTNPRSHQTLPGTPPV